MDTFMLTSSAKAKGRNLQNFVASKLRDLFGFPESDCKSTSMGVSGVDIQLSEKAREKFNYDVECKSYANIAVYKWWEQAVKNSTNQPLLVIKANRKQPLVVLSWDQFEDLIKCQEK